MKTVLASVTICNQLHLTEVTFVRAYKTDQPVKHRCNNESIRMSYNRLLHLKTNIITLINQGKGRTLKIRNTIKSRECEKIDSCFAKDKHYI